MLCSGLVGAGTGGKLTGFISETKLESSIRVSKKNNNQ